MPCLGSPLASCSDTDSPPDQSCHNERVARSRRHAEAKQRAKAKKEEREREKAKLASEPSSVIASKPLPPLSSPAAVPRGSGSDGALASGPSASSSRNIRSPGAVPSRTHSPSSEYPLPSPHVSSPSYQDVSYPQTGDKLLSLSPVPDARDRAAARLDRRKEERIDLSNYSPTPSPSPGSKAVFDDGRLDRLSPRPVSEAGSPSASRFADDIRRGSTTPRSPVFPSEAGGTATIGLGVGPVTGLAAPSSRAARRQSINPAMVLNYQEQQPHLDISHSPLHSSFNHQNVDALSVTRGSPMPPSPLRSSFSDGHGRPTPASTNRGASPMANGVLSPIPNRMYSSGNKESSRDLAAITREEAVNSTPPRSSSLADSLHAATAFGGQRRPSISGDSNRTIAPASLREDSSSRLVSQGVVSTNEGVRAAPQIRAPELPSLDFSFSDNFGMMLEDKKDPSRMEATLTPTRPEAQVRAMDGLQRAQPTVSKVQPLNLPFKDGSSRSLPNSPAYPYYNGVSPKAHVGNNAPSRRPSDVSRQTPSSETGDPFYSPDLGTRNDSESQESATLNTEHDNSSYLDRESALPRLQSLLAKEQQQGSTVAQIDIGLLDKVIGEITEFNKQVQIFSQKYSSAKVCFPLHVLFWSSIDLAI